jgi:hypothetical protein
MGSSSTGMKTRRRAFIVAVAAGVYLVLWLLTYAVGAPRVLRSARAAEAKRVGTSYPEDPMRVRALGPFVVAADRLFAFSVRDLASGEGTARTYKTTSLYLWIGTPLKLADGLWESEVSASAAKGFSLSGSK